MRIVAFFLIVILKTSLSCQVKVIEYRGNVYFRESSLSQWVILSTSPFELLQGSGIKLDEDSKVRLSVNDNSEVVLYEGSALEIESVSKYYVTLGLVYGKGRFDISFPPNSTFVLKTISSHFTGRNIKGFFESDLKGKVEVSLGFGECVFKYLIPHKSGKREFVLNQGMFFKVEGPEKPYIIGMIDPDKEDEILEKWSIKEEVDLARKDRIRRLVSFSNYAYGIASRYGSDGHKEKNSDFESGKTLRDIHGNLLRIEQRILRPSPNEIQFINITKRPYYKDYENTSFSMGREGFRYNGGDLKNRVDVFAVSFSFNKDMPKNIQNLPSFFADPSVEANWATFVSANVSSDESFFVAEAYRYNPSRGEMINNTESVGVPQDSNERDRDVIISGKISKDLLYDIVNYNFKEKDPSSPTGELVRKTDGSVIQGAFWGVKTGDEFEIKGDIYNLKGYRYLKGAAGNEYFWVTSENYLISPSGAVRKRREIEENFRSFSDVLSRNFLQSIIYVKGDDNSSVSDQSYNGIDSNIDLLISGEVLHSSFESIREGIDRWKN